MGKPVVSVICLVYNMKDYLRQALDSILMQKTDFPFEIVIHDDASTDGSTDIVREYAEKYPDIIVPIIQTENQHSKKTHITNMFIVPKLRGQYAAYCEGDDYWTDPYKLQKQFDFMDAHPEYSLCAARIRQINCLDASVPDKLIRPIDHTGEVSVKQILLQKERQAFCTCSLFFRMSVFMKRPDDFPNRGDRMLVLWLALNGKVWFIDEEMGVYRRARPGSWSVSNYHSGAEKKIQLFFSYIRLYKRIDIFSEYKYNDSFKKCNLNYMKMAVRAGAKLTDISKKDIKDCYDELSFMQKLSLRTEILLGPARNAASALKRKLRKKK